MTDLFLYGTLRHAPLLALVLGRAAETRPARLDGFAVDWAEAESFPVIRPRPGAVAEGLLLRGLDATDMARLDFYEGAFGYALVPVKVTVEGREADAHIYQPDPDRWPAGAPFSLAEWERDWAAITLDAAAEVMRQFGTATPGDIARRFAMIRSRAQSRLLAGRMRRPHTIGPDFTRADVVVEELRHPYYGFFTMEEYTARHRQFDGTMSAPAHRAVFRAGDAVTVLPYDPGRDSVLMVQQVRLGAYAHGDPQPWLLEPIAGIVDAGESYETTARREAEEESGVTIGALHHVARYYPSPGGVAQILVSYVGIAELPPDLPGLGGLDSEGEDILSHIVAFDAAMDMLATGELANAPLIITMQWLAAHRDRLRAAASG